MRRHLWLSRAPPFDPVVGTADLPVAKQHNPRGPTASVHRSACLPAESQRGGTRESLAFRFHTPLRPAARLTAHALRLGLARCESIAPGSAGFCPSHPGRVHQIRHRPIPSKVGWLLLRPKQHYSLLGPPSEVPFRQTEGQSPSLSCAVVSPVRSFIRSQLCAGCLSSVIQATRRSTRYCETPPKQGHACGSSLPTHPPWSDIRPPALGPGSQTHRLSPPLSGLAARPAGLT